MARMKRFTTSEFVDVARRFAVRAKSDSPGNSAIAYALVRYFEKGVSSGQIPEYGENTGVMFIQYLEKYLDDAWEFFYSSQDADAVDFRQRYTEEFGREVPRLTEINGYLNGGGLERTGAITTLSNVVNDIVGEGDSRIRNEIRQYFFAQDTTLEQKFQRFVRQVYKQGLFDLIKASKSSGMSGTFGSTVLRTHCSAGRIMMTFAKPDPNKLGEEKSFTFAGEETEAQGKRFGPQSVYVDLSEALSMIHEVIDNWPPTAQSNHEERRKLLFRDDQDVCIQFTPVGS